MQPIRPNQLSNICFVGSSKVEPSASASIRKESTTAKDTNRVGRTKDAGQQNRITKGVESTEHNTLQPTPQDLATTVTTSLPSNMENLTGSTKNEKLK